MLNLLLAIVSSALVSITMRFSETKIKNIKAYLISALFNAPTTIANSVSAEFAYYQNLS